jgi:hypothetical protein
MATKRKPLTAKSPADQLFEDQPEHVREIYRQHKAHKRAKQRKQYLDAMQGKDISE